MSLLLRIREDIVSPDIVVIVAVAANLVSTMIGLLWIANKIDQSGHWRGSVDTTLKEHSRLLGNHGAWLNDHEKRLSNHEGEAKGGA